MQKVIKMLLPFILLASLYLGFYAITHLIVYFTIGIEGELTSYYWVRHVYYYGKRQQMFSYLVNGLGLFVVLLGFRLVVSYKPWADRIRALWAQASEEKQIQLTLSALFFNFLFWQAFHERQTVVRQNPALALSLAVLLFGAQFFVGSWFLRSTKSLSFVTSPRSVRALFLAMICCVSFLYWKVYEPLYSGRLPFINEYLNLPSTLHLDQGSKNTIKSLNAIKPLGIKIEEFDKFDDAVERPVLKSQAPQLMLDLAKENPYILHFDTYTSGLVAVSPINEALEAKMRELNLAPAAELDRFLTASHAREEVKAKKLSVDESSFMGSFSWLLTQQVYSRWYIHHHNFVTGPLNKVTLGYDWKKVFFQYGVIGGLVQAKASEFIFGAFNFQNYFKTWVIFFLIYFVVFLVGTYLIVRDLHLVFLAASAFLVFLYTQTFEHTFLGPGLNPLRHFFDIFIFWGLTVYVRTRSIRFLFLTSLLAFLNFCLNPEFGLFCYVGLLMGLGYFAVSERTKPNLYELMVLVGFGVLHALAWFGLRVGTEGVVSLYLGGFFSPTVPHGKVMACFITLFLGMALVTLKQGIFDPKKVNLFFASAVYSILILSYCLWGRTWNHLVNISPILILSAVIFIDAATDLVRGTRWLSILRTGTVLLALVGIFEGVRIHRASKTDYFRMLERYENRKFTIPGMEILTSIPEAPIKNAVELIKKYAKDNRIVIFSKFDNILLFASRTYSPLPANELMAFMMSPAEKALLKEYFVREAPEVILADTDILSPVTDELIDPNTPMVGGLFIESSMRLERVNNLKLLFAEIAPDYELGESSGVLAVWKKKKLN